MGRERKKGKLKSAELPQGKARLNLLLDADLKAWVHEHARKNHTTVTAIVVEHFLALKRESYGTGVKQI